MFYGIGINSDRKKSCLWGSLHAEIDALRKIRRFEKTRRVDIVVIRVNRTGGLLLSQPCSNCIKKMRYFERYKNCVIDKIRYSGEHGDIISHKLRSIDTAITPHISRKFR